MSSARRALAVGVALIALATACSSSSGGSGAQSSGAGTSSVQVEAISTRPEYVTGGDVLVAVHTASGALDGITVHAGDQDVTAAFRAQNGALTGLVSGLPDGPTQIVAQHGGDKGTLDVVNHAQTGPLFSGPQLDPYICKTDQFGLGAPTDANCSAPTKTEQSDVGGVATTVEKGVIDRSIYTIAFPGSSWNHRLVYRFGGGCGTCTARVLRS